MSIATEIQRLQTAKAAIKQAIIDKGVSVSSSDKLDSFASKISQIPSGGSINNYDRTIELTVTDIGIHTYQVPSGYTGHGVITVRIVDSQVVLTCDKITLTVDAQGQVFTTNNLKFKLYDGNTLLYTWTFNDTSSGIGDSVTIVSNEAVATINVGYLTNDLKLILEGGVDISGYDLLNMYGATFFGRTLDVQDDTSRTFTIGNVRNAGSSPAQISLDFKPQI